jgi:hypothetical protein
MKTSQGSRQGWEAGIAEFNAGRYWHAHEQWEIGWKNLPSPEKEYIQALIQTCGMLFLALEKSRFNPALALGRSALVKLRRSSSDSERNIVRPIPMIAGLEKALLGLDCPPTSRAEWEIFARSLQAGWFA